MAGATLNSFVYYRQASVAERWRYLDDFIIQEGSCAVSVLDEIASTICPSASEGQETFYAVSHAELASVDGYIRELEGTLQSSSLGILPS